MMLLPARAIVLGQFGRKGDVHTDYTAIPALPPSGCVPLEVPPL